MNWKKCPALLLHFFSQRDWISNHNQTFSFSGLTLNVLASYSELNTNPCITGLWDASFLQSKHHWVGYWAETLLLRLCSSVNARDLWRLWEVMVHRHFISHVSQCDSQCHVTVQMPTEQHACAEYVVCYFCRCVLHRMLSLRQPILDPTQWTRSAYKKQWWVSLFLL